jgi:RNA ligase
LYNDFIEIKTMNYEFPDINHISDVIPHIEDRPEFKVMEKDWYTVINYMVAFEDTFSLIRGRSHYNMWMRRECRGLIFDTATGNLISRPYHKFFNVGERDETQIDKLNFSSSHVVLEKLDGSMIRPIPTPEGFRLGTKAGITDVAMNAEVFIGDKPHYAKFINYCIENGLTPIFEWVSRKNRIVVDYPKDQLILTGIRNLTKGNYLPYFNMVELASHYDIPYVIAFSGSVPIDEDLINTIRAWDDGEGVVIRFEDGHMVKIKADDYVLRHKSKDAINQEKNVIETIITDAVDDLIPLLTPEDADRIRKFEKAFWLSVDDLAFEMAELFVEGNTEYPDKKDFAVEFVQKQVKGIHAPIMYAIKGGKGAKDVIIGMISKSLSTQTKIDQSRWLWGGLKWN